MHWLPAILLIPYLFLLLKIYRSLLTIKTPDITVEPGTFVSVVIACHNEQDNLPEILKCIAGQDYPKGLYEVLIIDDNSSDKTNEIAAGFKETGNFFLLKNTGRGKKKAVRTGVDASSGSLIITTDADCRMGKKWIRTIAAFYEENRPDLIICPVMIEPGPGLFRRIQEIEFLSLQGITAGTAIGGNGTMCNGANLAFKKETYKSNAANLQFEIASGDDVFLLHSMKKQAGSKILWLDSAEAVVTTAASTSVYSFLNQRSRWISKAIFFNDRFTIILGFVTFVTIMLQISLFAAVLIEPSYIWVFLALFLLKSIPDFLIILNTTLRYGRKKLMIWFLPAQIIYPFYVLGVVCYSLSNRGPRKINSPFPTEI